MTVPDRALVFGLAVTGRAVSSALVRRGVHVIAADDHPSVEARAAAELFDVKLLEAPDVDALSAALSGVDAVFPSPGVPDGHPLFAARDAGVAVMSEFDLAADWDARPVVAITGTDGKTTVTSMVTDMLNASGMHAIGAGNTELPLVEAIDDPSVDVFVVEASSFRLGHTLRFSPSVGTWLNFAPDHLDVHASIEAYESAKARLWSAMDDDATAVANAADPVVMRHVPDSGHVVTFGVGVAADVVVRDGVLHSAEGDVLVHVDEMFRALPHDVANALAASASALAGGASLEGTRAALRSFAGLAHRVELVGTSAAGVRYIDDSKATVPHATLAALAGFDSVVLIAGGRNKGLDLRALVAGIGHVRAVVAIGEAGPEVADAFDARCPVHLIDTNMDDAVAAAAASARPGDVVLLSPGCASFDWYDSYHSRGLAFQAAVGQLLEGER